MLKTNVRYTFPAVQRRNYTPPVGTGLAPMRPSQLKKLRLTPLGNGWWPRDGHPVLR